MRFLGATLCGLALGSAAAAPRPGLSNEAGTIVRGPAAGIDWARPVGAGDFDADGYEDLVIGASEPFGGGISTVHAIRGGPGGHARGILNLAVTPADLVIYGAEVDDNLGASVAAGDVNGDGIDDLLLVASLADFSGVVDRGIAYLLYGEPDFFADPTRDMADTADWDLRILGPVAGGDMGGALLFGGADAQAAAIGNLNGDQYGDMVLGVHLADGNQDGAGRVYVRLGGPFPTGFTLNFASPTAYTFAVWGSGELDELGTVVLTGDLTGDGIDELIMPAEYGSHGGFFSSEGEAFILRGRATWSTTLFNLATTPADITLHGARAWDNLGTSAAVGDFNGDGVTDLAVSAQGADAGAYNDQRGDGFVYGLLGGPQWQTGTHLLNYMSAAPDFLLIGDFEKNLGERMAAADFNGDGIDDIAAAEWFGGPNNNGVVEVLLGREFAAQAVYTANVNTDLRIRGSAANDRISFSLGVVNLNGDALPEISFGAPFNNGGAGTVYAYTFVSADADFDRDVDLRDFAALQPCVGVPFGGPPSLPCVLLDFTLDETVDGNDLDAFLSVWSGPGEE